MITNVVGELVDPFVHVAVIVSGPGPHAGVNKAQDDGVHEPENEIEGTSQEHELPTVTPFGLVQ